MEECLAVEREVDNVLEKFNDIRQKNSDVLQQLIDNLETIRDNLAANNLDDEGNKSAINLIQTFVNESKYETQKLASEHRELHSSISKVGKAIDRNFISDISSTSKENIFSDPDDTISLNHIICNHFYKLGKFDIGDELIKESGIIVESSIKEQFTEINHIKESLKNKNIIPALEWIKENRSKLSTQMYAPLELVKRVSNASKLPVHFPFLKRARFSGGIMKPRPKTKKIKRLELAKKILDQFFKSSSLEFKLHQLAFFTIIKKGVDFQTEAVEYARVNFGPFVGKHEKDIQIMMGMLLYLPQGIDKSPYSEIAQENMWEEVNKLFDRDACSLLGISVDSLLNTSINVGCVALPALLNIKHVMKQRKIGNIWREKDELPIEIELDPENRYHSMFTCPILRQHSSETNPPMKLICGHIISKDALNKLGSSNNKLKCPYCPVEQSSSEAKRIHF